MDTEIIEIDILNIDQNKIKKAAEIIINGGLVAFPTETVYGIGANALDYHAVQEIYKAKGRPSDNPLIVHIASNEDVYKYAVNVSRKAILLMEAFWPGPLTMIFDKSDRISAFITGGLDTVALRLPSNEIARRIIEESKLPIAAPSANRSGRPSPTRAKHVIEDLAGRVEMIIDGGKATIGLESTVIDMTSKIPTILRPGSITLEMIQAVIGETMMDPAFAMVEAKVTPKSPGMKYKHYAPKGHLTIVEGEEKQAIDWINERVGQLESEGHLVAVIATDEDANQYRCKTVTIIGSRVNHAEIAGNLFKVLRLMDENHLEYIFSRGFSEEDIGKATMNRLLKAAGNQRVSLG